MGVHNQGGCKFPNCVIGSHDDIMCNRLEGNRYVAVMDIPGAFLYADIDDMVHMFLKGAIAESIVRLEP